MVHVWITSGGPMTYPGNTHTAIVFEVAHGDLHTSSYSPYKTFFLYIWSIIINVGSRVEAGLTVNGRLVTF
jgi:hypothetical protein